MSESTNSLSVIKPPSRWGILNLKELVNYRDLFVFLVWRDIKVLYAQTILGFAWAIINPLVQIVIFSIIFGKVAKLDTDGIPYILFSTVAVIPWTYMSDALNRSSQSLVSGQNMLGKVYFPRLIFPATPVLAKLVDFFISLTILVGVMIYYQVELTTNLFYLPIFFVAMMLVPAGIGMALAAMAIRYRDVKFAMPFAVRMLIYSAPILYSASKIPEEYRFYYSFNPIVSVVEGYRACLLGLPMQWQYIYPGLIMAVLIFILGLVYFKKMERIFVDVI
ncbi:MAG: ABC transporter permease [Pseudomonadota bacterium]